MRQETITMLRNAAQHLRDRLEAQTYTTPSEWRGDALAIDTFDGIRCIDGDERQPDDSDNSELTGGCRE